MCTQLSQKAERVGDWNELLQEWLAYHDRQVI